MSAVIRFRLDDHRCILQTNKSIRVELLKQRGALARERDTLNNRATHNGVIRKKMRLIRRYNRFSQVF